jgi:uncharacterized protein YcaQ
MVKWRLVSPYQRCYARKAMTLTNAQARLFLLRRHGLAGEHVFKGKEGVMAFIKRAGCLQFDPVDLCGRNADIALNSRVYGYTKEMLEDLLYKERRLIDYFDKNLSIFPVEDFLVFVSEKPSGGYAEAYDARGGEAVQQIKPRIRQLIAERGQISAKEVNVDDKIVWHWGALASLPRAALESMYFRGELIIHHKTGVNKSYAFAKELLPAGILNAPLPFGTEEERQAWLVKRRIGSVGMLWNRTGGAFLGLRLKPAQRAAAFGKLLAEGEIFEVSVKGIKEPFYIREDERAALEEILAGVECQARSEFIAPLDNLLWDRRLIEALFGFEYRWEIYTTQEKRKYGPYTLPFLYGDNFAGRVDITRRGRALLINEVWTENGKPFSKKTGAAFEECAERFAEFNNCERVEKPGKQ